jgi:predicted nuclease with TOPRIM domain
MRNITLSADDKLIDAARERARAENSTLNEQFRRWLGEYAHSRERMQRYDEVMARVRGRLKVGHKLTRDEMNER